MKTSAYLGVIVVLGLFFFAGLTAKAEGPKPPTFELVSLSGDRFTQDDLRGKVTLLVFWASWCGVCKHELPKIHALQQSLAGKPFQVLAIGFKDSEDNIRRFAKMHPDTFSFPVYFDRGDRVASKFGATVTPTLFLFDKNGELAVPYRGGGLLEHPQFQQLLTDLL